MYRHNFLLFCVTASYSEEQALKGNNRSSTPNNMGNKYDADNATVVNIDCVDIQIYKW